MGRRGGKGGRVLIVVFRTLWKRRLLGCQHNVDVWQSLLAVHKLVIPPLEELDMWLKFIGLCRKVHPVLLPSLSLLPAHFVPPPLLRSCSNNFFFLILVQGGRLGHAHKTLTMLMGQDPASHSMDILPSFSLSFISSHYISLTTPTYTPQRTPTRDVCIHQTTVERGGETSFFREAACIRASVEAF